MTPDLKAYAFNLLLWLSFLTANSTRLSALPDGCAIASRSCDSIAECLTFADKRRLYKIMTYTKELEIEKARLQADSSVSANYIDLLSRQVEKLIEINQQLTAAYNVQSQATKTARKEADMLLKMIRRQKVKSTILMTTLPPVAAITGFLTAYFIKTR